jgi:hypothetical protein
MIRNIKVLLIAGMAVAALGALSASSAQASGEQYHCTVAPCEIKVNHDGTSKTAHQVFDFQVNGGNLTTVTCPGITGDATSATKTTTELTITGLSYGAANACNVGGQLATVHTNGCHYLFTAGTPTAEGEVHIQCPAGKAIEITFNTCTVSVGSQTLKKSAATTGILYHNVGTEVTVESNLDGIHGTTTAACPGGAGTFITGTYTTGNALVTGQVDPGGAMATVFYE